MNKKKTIKFAENSQRSITGKGDDACGKEKRLSFWQTKQSILTLSGSVCRTNNTIFLSGVLGTTHTSLVAVRSLSVSIMLKYTRPTMDCKLRLTGLWQNFQKKTNPYRSPKYQMRTHTYMKRINVFLTP